MVQITLRRFIISGLLLSAGLFSVKLYSYTEGNQWSYVGISPAGTGKAYTGVASLDNAGDIAYNPAAPAAVNRFTLSASLGFLSGDTLLNAGVSLPLPNGILSVGANLTGSVRPSGNISGFHIGYSKLITENFAFGFKGYAFSQTAGTNSSDLGLGVDVGSILKIKDILPYENGFGLKNNSLGLALVGLGKVSQISGNDPVPGIGIKGGLSGTIIDFGAVRAMASLESTVHAFPLNYFAQLGLTISIIDHLKLRGGLLAGNNGLGDPSMGLGMFTLGASFSYLLGSVPIEVCYSYNPHQYSGVPGATHFLATEIGFGVGEGQQPQVNLAIEDTTTNEVWFSPNYDGSQDAVALRPQIKDEELLKSWQLVIFSDKGQVLRIFKGEEERDVSIDLTLFWKKLWAKRESVPVPERIVWDGRGNGGAMLPDGLYYCYFMIEDALKRVVLSPTNAIHLKNTPPGGSFAADDLYFSPNGDGRKDSFQLNQKLSLGDNWRAEVRDINGKLRKNWTWGVNPPSELSWDGSDENGALLAEGSYDLLIYGEDPAGNRSMLPVRGINLSTNLFSVYLSMDKRALSPVSRTGSDKMLLSPVFPDTNGLLSWEIKIKDQSGAVRRSYQGKAPQELLNWNGKDQEGRVVKDGTYYFRIKAEFRSGEVPESQDYPVVIDTKAPVASLSMDPPLFSPDGDGENEQLDLRPLIDDPAGVQKWKIVLQDPDKKPFKTFEGEGKPAQSIVWDGRSDNGELVESAQDYPVNLYTTDALGNETNITVKSPIHVDVLVEKTDRGLKIRINNIEFEFAKAVLKGRKMPVLDRVAQILSKYGNYKVEVQGHTDNIGSEKKNMDLSKQRALVVFDYLADKGIAKSRMTAVGYGFTYPIADNETEEGRRKNRRVEFILIKNP